MNKNPAATIFAGTPRRGSARLKKELTTSGLLGFFPLASVPRAIVYRAIVIRTIVFRTTVSLACVLPVSALLTALPALAAGEKPPGAMDLVWQGVNLFTLLAIIIYFARKPVAAFFRGAAGRQQDSFQAAQRESEEIAAELEAQKQKIAGLERELERMVEGAKADAEEERRQMTAATEAQAERIRTQARNQVQQEMSKATGELRAQLADEAVKLAEELIRSRMDDDRRQQLISNYIQQLGAQR